MEGKYLTMETYRGVRAFLNVMRDVCANCNRRSEDNCPRCDLNVTGDLLKQIDAAQGEVPPTVKAARVGGFLARCRCILRQLLDHGPCMSSEIDTTDYGTRRDKWWCLHTLARRGIVIVIKQDMGFYAYDVNRKRMDTIRAILGDEK